MATVLAWGSSRALGAGCLEDDNFTSPHLVQSLQGYDIRSISSGENHTLVCRKDGTVYSAGGNDVTLCGRDRNLMRFEQVKQGLENNENTKRVTEVAVGSSHNIVLTESHEVFTWGQNNLGQLGRGNVPEHELGIPRPIETLAKHNVLQVTCGNAHTMVLTDTSLVGVWGSNAYGQLGLGKNKGPYRNLPAFVSCLKGIPVAQVAAGGNHSFILSKSGTIYGWGRNSFGQLGVTNAEDHFVPVQCKQLRRKEVTYICCGENHTACLTASGQVFTFGSGTYGQLGHKDSSVSSVKALDLSASELPGAEVTQIACGRNHTLVYISQSGYLYSFGLGGSGQLGLSDTQSRNLPVLIPCLFQPGNKQKPNLTIKRIHAGGNHSFVIAEDANACQSEDFRRSTEARQILSLSQDRIQALLSSKTPDKQLLREVLEIFSNAGCLNGSFLLQKNQENYGNKRHGVDIDAVQKFFKDLQSLQSDAAVQKIEARILQLIPRLLISPPDTEALRIYLILPECHFFDKPRSYSSIICRFAKSFLALGEMAQKNLGTWWSLEDSSLFQRLVTIYKRCVEYILQLPKSPNQSKFYKRNEELKICMEMLKRLLKINEAHNRIIPYQDFYVKKLSDDVLKAYNDKMNSAVNGTYDLLPFVYWDFLCLYDAAAKSILLHLDSLKQMQRVVVDAQQERLYRIIRGARMPPEQPFDVLQLILKLDVDRENILEDTFEQLRGKPAADLRKPLRVSFKGELGQDEGGPRKEFLILIFQEVAKPENGLFQTEEPTPYLWFTSDARDKDSLEKYSLIGTLCGMAIFNNIVIDLPFPLVFYKKLLDRPLGLDDLEELMPDHCRGLHDLLKEEEDDPEGIFGFTFEDEGCGSDAGDRPVTLENRQEYVDLIVDQKLNKSVEDFFNAFKEGFCKVCNKLVFDSLQPEELQTLLLGDENYDFKILEENAKYEGFWGDEDTIKFFWEVLHELDLEKKKDFLRFFTGSHRIPVIGMQSIKMTIQPLENIEDPSKTQKLMPEASTCFSQLRLPAYDTKEILKERLLLALEVKTFDTL